MTFPGDSSISCREATNLLPLFIDGELDARHMRAVALHGTRCPTCESELRSIEHLQGLLAETINDRVEKIDFSEFWTGLESQLPAWKRSWRSRLADWWAEIEFQRSLAWPALAAAAVGALLALLLFTRVQQPTTQPGAPIVASVDAPAMIDSLDSDMGSVAVVNDPENRTTVLWVSEDLPVSGDRQ